MAEWLHESIRPSQIWKSNRPQRVIPFVRPPLHWRHFLKCLEMHFWRVCSCFKYLNAEYLVVYILSIYPRGPIPLWFPYVVMVYCKVIWQIEVAVCVKSKMFVRFWLNIFQIFLAILWKSFLTVRNIWKMIRNGQFLEISRK